MTERIERVIITGASSGIGRDLARRLVAAGPRIIIKISDAVLYLARAGFVTGTVLDVDGGYAHGR
ncbi:MAG: SDR family NAD(P)-dependent oxidoreductase [Nannocystis sp.]|nr:SDR family NAD(P)-dependent oxidoreductase [Nannocystis sp.]MBA3550003.1 SDR family NAD(P)-dependent oxidoreductase [Nannocystis sp.]